MIAKMVRAALVFGLILFFSPVIYSQSAKKLVKTGDNFFEAKQYRDAFENYNKAKDIDPKMFEAYLGMGKSLYRMGREAEAFGEFQRAAAFGTKEWEPLFYLGKIHADREEWNDAVSNLTQASELDRKNQEVRRALFHAQANKGVFRDALETAESLLKVDKRDAVNIYLLGVALDSLKRYPEAEKQYVDARFKDPKLMEVYLGAAHVRMKLGENQKALEDCTKAIEINSKSVAAYVMRSKVKLNLGDFSGAINDLSAALEIAPDNLEIRSLRGKVFRKSGQHQNAIGDWTAILSHDPDNSAALYDRAADYEAINDLKNAERDYENLRRLSPYDEKAAAMLDNVRNRLHELKRETGLPQLELTSHVVTDLGFIEIPNDQNLVRLEGRLIDESLIKELTVNQSPATVPVDSLNPEFEFEFKVGDARDITFAITDIYNNTNRVLYKVKRTEVQAPEVQLLAPYSSDDGTIRITGNISDIHVEGRIRDESFIRRITINGTNASFVPDQFNPAFTANVRVANRSHLSVVAEDIFGNVTEQEFEIDRSGTTLLNDNPMGRTWVVFVENSNYDSFASIDGPAKDVNIMKQAFSNYHIENIIHKKNMDKTDMERFFSIDLRDLVRSNKVNSLLVWFAGHGKYINDTGYWIPVDASRDDEFSFFNINSLKTGLQSYSDKLTHTLVVTDACESGPSFADVMRDKLPERRCDDWEAARMKSSQVFSSAGYELASDHSQFTRTFANMLGNNPDACLPIESVVVKVSEVVTKQGKQSPKFGVIDGLGDENGTFFFMRKSN